MSVPRQHDLFRSGDLPQGFTYLAEFLSVREESELLEIVRSLPLQEAQYRSGARDGA
jgi:hypothetical protein